MESHHAENKQLINSNRIYLIIVYNTLMQTTFTREDNTQRESVSCTPIIFLSIHYIAGAELMVDLLAIVGVETSSIA